jgi:MoxR-like ATPase
MTLIATPTANGLPYLDERRHKVMNDWNIFRGTGKPHDGIARLPAPPPWRRFRRELDGDSLIPWDLPEDRRGETFQATPEEIEFVNMALYLRRPLLITGKPGTGKSSLAHAVAYELKLGPVLAWPINTRSTLQEGLYRYDAIGRLQAKSLGENGQASAESQDIGRYIRLGALGTAMLPSMRPRVLLIDEIDKSDIDLPNDLLNIFEEGEYEIPELSRLPNEPSYEQIRVQPYNSDRSDQSVHIHRGRVRCHEFPFVVLTSNGEREFPPAFRRRCLHLDIKPPDEEDLVKIVNAHFKKAALADQQQIKQLVNHFVKQRDVDKLDLPTDQLLQVIYFVLQGVDQERIDSIIKDLWKVLDSHDQAR